MWITTAILILQHSFSVVVSVVISILKKNSKYEKIIKAINVSKSNRTLLIAIVKTVSWRSVKLTEQILYQKYAILDLFTVVSSKNVPYKTLFVVFSSCLLIFIKLALLLQHPIALRRSPYC